MKTLFFSFMWRLEVLYWLLSFIGPVHKSQTKNRKQGLKHHLWMSHYVTWTFLWRSEFSSPLIIVKKWGEGLLKPEKKQNVEGPIVGGEQKNYHANEKWLWRVGCETSHENVNHFKFACLFEWTPFWKKESEYSLIRNFDSDPGLALMVSTSSRQS